MSKNILVSACLLGENVKYSGGNNFSSKLTALLRRYDVNIIPICPEVLGGLPIPRLPAEIIAADIIDCNGQSVLAEFQRGADAVLQRAKQTHCRIAVLKENSPSCGSRFIYDGTFSGTLIEGEGLTTQLLRRHHIEVFSELNLAELENRLKKEYQDEEK
ncbi:DUF523 domain-containing protein [Caviibacterium pharyngocola]|uniref:DUF523 domain-containing protein n=1 Tax=Caviibacterium pharyngocola TaxID=28159 RepID=UPI001FAFB056|nr:DUF523 domain-containing protein [Caviibacterium pharyngocola]